MATRSTISMVYEDGTVKTSYCHWDGYPSNNGVILLTCYQDPQKVKDLIGLGQISSLGAEVSPKGKHDYDKPEDGVTVFYGRDRGEKDVDAQNHKNLKEYVLSGDFQEYNYVYMESKKKWYLLDEETNKLKPLYGVVSKCRKDMGLENGKMFDNYLKQRKAERLYKKMNEELPENNKVTTPKPKM